MAALNFVIFSVVLLLAVSTSVISSKDLDILKIPESCKGHRFCSEKPEGYDKIAEKIKKVLPKFLIKEYSERKGTDAFECEMAPKINNDCCPYTVKCEQMYTFLPYDNNTEPDIIIQLDGHYRQYIPTVTCINKNTSSNVQCFKGLLHAVHNKVSHCELSYARRNIYTYDRKQEKVVLKSYNVPSCCSCSISYNI